MMVIESLYQSQHQFPIEVYTSSSTLLQVSNSILEDLKEGSLEFNLLVSELEEVMSKKYEVVEQQEEKSKDQLNNELDEIEALVEKIKSVKSRKEKRKLMAEYNQKQAFKFKQDKC